jgi:hypothetical protein
MPECPNAISLRGIYKSKKSIKAKYLFAITLYTLCIYFVFNLSKILSFQTRGNPGVLWAA